MQSADLLKGAGFPAVEGWYATVASPHFEEAGNARAKAFSDAYFKKFNQHPDDYTITCYTGAEVIVQAVKDLVKAHKAVDRNSVRDAIQKVDLKSSLIGPVEFDANGDLKNKVISVFQIKKNEKAPLDDPTAQYKYIGTAPMS
jgi:branched-chain amino acid transport system substrate-binding protein